MTNPPTYLPIDPATVPLDKDRCGCVVVSSVGTRVSPADTLPSGTVAARADCGACGGTGKVIGERAVRLERLRRLGLTFANGRLTIPHTLPELWHGRELSQSEFRVGMPVTGIDVDTGHPFAGWLANWPPDGSPVAGRSVAQVLGYHGDRWATCVRIAYRCPKAKPELPRGPIPALVVKGRVTI